MYDHNLITQMNLKPLLERMRNDVTLERMRNVFQKLNAEK